MKKKKIERGRDVSPPAWGQVRFGNWARLIGPGSAASWWSAQRTLLSSHVSFFLSLCLSLSLSCLVLPIFLLSSFILVRLGLLFRLLLPLWMRHNKSVLHLHALHFISVEWRRRREETLHCFWNCVELQLSRRAAYAAPAAVPLAVAVAVPV